MSIKKTKRGYQVDVRDANGQRIRKLKRTRKDAEALERHLLDQRDQGILPHRGTDTLGGFVEEYRKTHYQSIRANTEVGYKGSLRKHILPWFGDTRLKNIDQRSVQEWVNHLVDQGLSPRTVEYHFSVLTTILNLAAQYGLCKPVSRSGRNRAGVRLPKKIRREIQPPTIAQVELLASLIDPRYSALVKVAGYCGLRQSECFGLHPSSVDFERHKIHVRRTVEHSTGALVDMTKNGRPRTVTMLAPVEEALREHMAEYPHSEFVFHRSGGRLDSSHFHRDAWKPAREAAGLPTLHFHHLRHAAASIMAAGGWTANKVQKEIGHHSPGFTLEQYTHLWQEDEDSQRLGLDDAIRVALEAAKSAPGQTRTGTPQRAEDFEPPASTDSATGADDEDTAYD